MPSSSPSTSTLPTSDVLGTTSPESVEAEAIARAWINLFAARVASQDIDALINDALYSDPWWRDLFALTWDIRTFHGRRDISQFLADRLATTRFGDIELLKATYQTPYPDLAWIAVSFTFVTDVALGRGEARLVYCSDKIWRAATVYTNLEGLRSYPERVGPRRDFNPDLGKWIPRASFTEDPDVLIIGGGQTGLSVAARLDALGVSNLVVEADERVGDSWRKRHESLSLHGPIWQNHMPYFSFPTTWPVFIPANKFANWLELYADALEINVQTSTSATSMHRNAETQTWDVTIRKPSGSQRFLSVKHVVVAAGWPFKRTTFAGQDEFSGTIVHSEHFRSAAPYVGKKVLVVGACSSAHDAASDCANLGIDVTMYQRSRQFVMSINPGMLRASPSAEWEAVPTEDVDRAKFALPVHLAKHLAKRTAALIRDDDRDMLDGLAKAGYLTSKGEEDAGAFFPLLRGSGYYLGTSHDTTSCSVTYRPIDRGASQQIVDGKIKMKSGVNIERFTRTGVRFNDGTELDVDVVVVATGFDDARLIIRDLLAGTVPLDTIPPIWGLDDETGEVLGAYRDLAPTLPDVWPVLGNLAWVRWFSRHVALQIKAKLMGVYSGRYKA
ncbi:uncharacterized protein PHACADRAFT_132721 [Phanerochaete carnosa HHB-10118-sp]|uniref:FAD/NAD(P)-binding domain-containing protein n=1 Tax=Phanerochaete carnosa (strain HHB-10118-sp) TaxID=650164 RepID=K5VBF4_PHACS|nr:uncharacterized protein PHACADRAFT_132721 [Phanerochaete carnosa HHB-10118-sp]EKM60231.1 hypothetical protein PHACADRAFT_132721 [Phanerochaete carnosa HHB-10118-sp]